MQLRLVLNSVTPAGMGLVIEWRDCEIVSMLFLLREPIRAAKRAL
jgi:hypothetical protein